MKYLFVTLFVLLISHCLPAQTFEKNKKESADDFVKRILPENAFIQFKVLENKFNTPGKKIVFFYRKPAMDSTINDSVKINCMFANVLVPENETSAKYSLQTFKLDCNRGYNVTVDDAIFEKDKEKKIFVSVLFAQLNRKSTALIIKTYKP